VVDAEHDLANASPGHTCGERDRAGHSVSGWRDDGNMRQRASLSGRRKDRQCGQSGAPKTESAGSKSRINEKSWH
jgi:hypothetical protein